MRLHCAMLVLAALLWGASAGAQPPATTPGAPVRVGTAGGDVEVLADQMEQTAPDLTIATGNVEVTRGASRLLADRVEINRATGDTVATGHVIFYDGDDQLRGERIEYNIKSGTGVVYEGKARTAPYYRIEGERMERLAESRYHLRRGVFTTCEEETPAWSVHLGDADADLEDSLFGWNASFWLKNVPLIPWWPFFAAAIRRERQTGFLFPRFGSSTRKGLFAEQPFYWAISDSQDATVSVAGFSKRGPALHGEYRYVLSSANRGSATGFLVDETQRNNTGSDHGDLRGWYGFKHDWVIAPGFTAKADVNGVSDDSVLREYSDTLQQRSLQRVESNIFVSRSWQSWNFVANAFWYQDLTTAKAVELQRLPDLRLTAPRQPVPGLPGLLYQFEGSATKFVREVGSDGHRLDVHPRLSYPVSAAGFFTITPFAGGRLTAYDRTVVGAGVTADGTTPIELTADRARVRTLAEFGSDVEARAIRVYQVGGLGGWEALLHSIEPRVTYTWIAGKNTDQLPLWTEQIDKIPESRRIEYSITNRIRGRTAAPEGTEAVRMELARLLLGHSWDVKLGRAENVIADLLVQPSEILRVRADGTYGVHGEGLQTASADVSVTVSPLTASLGIRRNRQPGSNVPGTVIAPAVVPVVGTPVSRTEVNFLQATLAADLSQYVTARYSTNVDLRSDTFVENRFAIDVRFQCYGFTVEYVVRNQNEDEVRFALNLLGVGAPFTTSTGLGALGGGR
jgi:LPS-assembly protein